VDDRVGSLERGKDADLVLYDGDPFEYTTHVEAVIVNGTVAYQR
jgi:imidazolonepropionase-like amidohydrolase